MKTQQSKAQYYNPFNLLYPTPRFNKEELHKTCYPSVTNYSFGQRTISEVAVDIEYDYYFEKKLLKNYMIREMDNFERN